MTQRVKTLAAIAILALVSCKPDAIPPTVEAYSPPQNDIQEEAALLHGSIVSQGSSYVTSRVFEWGTDPTLSKYKTVEAGDGDGSFSCWLWGLTPATKYYYRAKATNDAGSSVSAIVSFTTGGQKSSSPTVKWKYEPYDITGEGATFCAEISSDGDSKVTQCGFCWSTDSSTPVLSNNNFIADVASGIGAFELKAKGLKIATKYNVRAWARNSIGIGYSSEVKTFTTEGLKIIDVSGEEFLEAEPSTSVKYRLTGGISTISNSNYGDISLMTDDGHYISVYGITLTDLGYGASNDKSFPSLKMRCGDRLTIVGFREDYQGIKEMTYAYVESYYRIKPSDYEGVWRVYAYHLYGNEAEEIKNTLTTWDANLYYSEPNLFFIESLYPEQNGSSYQSTPYTCAVAYYDDETANVYVLGQHFDQALYWWYNSDPSKCYMSVFTPVTVYGMGENWCSLGIPSVEEIGGYSPIGKIYMKTSAYWEPTTNYFYLSAVNKTSELDNSYVYKTYDYTPDSYTIGKEETQPQSPVYQFRFMIRKSDLPSSSTNRRSVKKMLPRQ